MTARRMLAHGSFVAILVVTSAYAQTTPSDGVKFLKGSPSTTARVNGNYTINASGEGDTSTYPQVKLVGTLAFMEVVQVDNNGKQVGGPWLFKGTTDPNGGATGTCSVASIKVYDSKTGEESEFLGFPTGK